MCEPVRNKGGEQSSSKPQARKLQRNKSSVVRLLSVSLVVLLVFTTAGTAFATEPELVVLDSIEANDPNDESVTTSEPSEETDLADNQALTEDQATDTSGTELEPADDGIVPLASTYPYSVTYDQVPNSTKVTVTLPNFNLLAMLNTTDSITIEATMRYGGQVVRSRTHTENLVALQAASADSFEMDFADYGKFTVGAKFYKASNLVTIGDTVTMGITADEYNIAPVSASLPLAYFSVSLFGSNSIRYTSGGDIIPTFLLLERPNSYNWNSLPEGLYALPYISLADSAHQPSEFTAASQRFRGLAPIMADYLADLYAMNPAAKFNLHVADVYGGLIQSFLYANRIPASQYTITVYSDGTYSYNSFNYLYNVSDPYAKHAGLEDEWNTAKAEAYQNGCASPGFGLIADSHLYAMISTESSAHWLLARPSRFLVSNASFTASVQPLNNPKIIQVNINTIMNTYSAAENASFKALFNFADTYFSAAEEAGKDVMLVLGTAPAYERDELADYLTFIKAFYGDSYAYYYKGHPSTPTDADPAKQQQLESLGVIDVDSSIPAELIIFFYPDTFFCGHQSTTWLSVPNGKGRLMIDITKAAGAATPEYSDVNGWSSIVRDSSPAAIRALCTVGNRSYVVEFSDAYISSLPVGEEYNIAIWDATAKTITYYKLDGGVYRLVSSVTLAEATLAEGLYELSPRCAPRMVIDISGGSISSGARAQIWNENSSPAQTFRIAETGDGYYTIENVWSNKLLDVQWAGMTAGTSVHQWDANNTLAQKWEIVDSSDGSFCIVSALNGLYLDVIGAGSSPGTGLCVYTGNGTNAQKFTLSQIRQPVQNGDYTVISALSGWSYDMVVDVAGGSMAAETNIHLWQSNNTGAQKFRLSYDVNTGYYTIQNIQSGLYVDVAGASDIPGANVWQYTGNASRAQMWRVRSNADGTITFVSATGCGCCLDVDNYGTTNGTNIKIFSDQANAAQKWYLKALP
jgi:hypothetical protein